MGGPGGQGMADPRGNGGSRGGHGGSRGGRGLELPGRRRPPSWSPTAARMGLGCGAERGDTRLGKERERRRTAPAQPPVAVVVAAKLVRRRRRAQLLGRGRSPASICFWCVTREDEGSKGYVLRGRSDSAQIGAVPLRNVGGRFSREANRFGIGV